MSKLKDRILRLIRDKAAREVGALAGQYLRVRPEEREAVQAGIDIERWLAEACQECLGKP